MSRYSRFDRERINKLFGKKNKIIKKPIQDRNFNFLNTSESVRNTTPFSSSNYITMQTVDKKRKYKQKLKFRCYQDQDVFGNQIYQFLKQQHQQEDDVQSTYEKIRFDVGRGINSLKEEIQLMNATKQKIIANED